MAGAKAQRGTKHDGGASRRKREEERQEWVDGEGQGQVTESHSGQTVSCRTAPDT